MNKQSDEIPLQLIKDTEQRAEYYEQLAEQYRLFAQRTKAVLEIWRDNQCKKN